MINFSKEKVSENQLPFVEVILSNADSYITLYIPCSPERIYQIVIDALKSGVGVTIDNYVYESGLRVSQNEIIND